MELLSSFTKEVVRINVALGSRTFLVTQNEYCVTDLENGEKSILQNGDAASTRSWQKVFEFSDPAASRN